MENPLNLRPRKGAYAYVTWLAPYLAGESNCMYLLHYKMNFFTPKAEADLGDWVEKHTRLVSNIIEEFKDMGGTISVEDENYFNVRSKTGVMIGGKSDVVIGEDNGPNGIGIVIDAKTGKQRAKDRIQVMLYMSLIPAVPGVPHITKIPYGEVRYSDGSSHSINPDEIDEDFKLSVKKLLTDSTGNIPKATPSVFECKWCDLNEICPHVIKELDEATEVDWL